MDPRGQQGMSGQGFNSDSNQMRSQDTDVQPEAGDVGGNMMNRGGQQGMTNEGLAGDSNRMRSQHSEIEHNQGAIGEPFMNQGGQQGTIKQGFNSDSHQMRSQDDGIHRDHVDSVGSTVNQGGQQGMTKKGFDSDSNQMQSKDDGMHQEVDSMLNGGQQGMMKQGFDSERDSNTMRSQAGDREEYVNNVNEGGGMRQAANQMGNQGGFESSNRRRLLVQLQSPIPPALDPQIEEYVRNHVLYSNLVNVDQDLPYQESSQIPYFWHVHKSGGSTLKHLMVCLDRVQTRRMTLPDCNDDEENLHTCKLEWGTVVNADASSSGGIARINKLGLLRDHIPNLVIDTSRVFEALSILNPERRGRFFVAMRDPVERAVSKYYYTKIATWERNWHPDIVNMTMLEFTESRYCYDNWITRRLVNKMEPGLDLTPEDLAIAKEILRQKALILLTNDMTQSSVRLVKYFGWPTSEYQQWCMNKFAVEEPINTNPHPVPDRNSREWQAIREKNIFDVQLYDYALQLFEAQSALIMQMVSHQPSADSITAKQNEGSMSGGDRNIPLSQGKLAQQFLIERAGVDKIPISEVGQPAIVTGEDQMQQHL
jgi:hypothetical protein